MCVDCNKENCPETDCPHNGEHCWGIGCEESSCSDNDNKQVKCEEAV